MSNLQAKYLHEENKYCKNEVVNQKIKLLYPQLKKWCEGFSANPRMSGIPMASDPVLAIVKIVKEQRQMRKLIDELNFRGAMLEDQSWLLYASSESNYKPTATELLEKTEIDESTLTRFSKQFGYTNIPELLDFFVTFEKSNPGGSKKVILILSPPPSTQHSTPPSTSSTESSTPTPEKLLRDVYNFEQLKDLWIKNGGDEGDSEIMAAIALAESSGKRQVINKNNSNGSWDIGLWQINTIHQGAFGLPNIKNFNDPNSDVEGSEKFTKYLYDPDNNVSVAIKIKKVQGYKAWCAYKSRAHEKYLPE